MSWDNYLAKEVERHYKCGECDCSCGVQMDSDQYSCIYCQRYGEDYIKEIESIEENGFNDCEHVETKYHDDWVEIVLDDGDEQFSLSLDECLDEEIWKDNN